MNPRLVHDASVAMAMAIVDKVNWTREEDRAEAFREFLVICKAGIEAYVLQEGRMLTRLNPTKN